METDPELAAAVARGAASFDQWIVARFNSQEGFADEDVRSAYGEYRDRVFAAFERSEGRVRSSFYCQSVLGAAVLTIKERPRALGMGGVEEPVLHLIYNVADSVGEPQEMEGLQAILYDAQALSVQVNELLRGKERHILLDQLYGLMTDLLALLDAGSVSEHAAGGESEASTDDGSENEESTDVGIEIEDDTGGENADGTRSLELQRAELERLGKRVRRSGTVQGQIAYLIGMLEGAGLLGSLAALGGWLLHRAGVNGTTLSYLTGALVSGGIGAIISVLARISRGSLYVNFEMGRRWLTVVGAMRPFVGAIFGLVLYGLLEGGFVPITLSGDEQARFFTVAVLSFAAGFNERWVQDVLLQTTGGAPKAAGSSAG